VSPPWLTRPAAQHQNRQVERIVIAALRHARAV
jgi:hypothetical protein